jgi:hypothetical protein
VTSRQIRVGSPPCALIYWVRFTAPDGVRWRVSYDTASRDHDVVDE